MKKQKQQDWQSELLVHAVLYRMIDKKEKIPLDATGTPFEFIDDTLTAMHTASLLKTNAKKECYEVTKEGLELREKARALYEEILHFETFAFVNLGVELDQDNSENGVMVDDDLYDPRFVQPENDEEAETLGTEDLRLALFDCLADHFKIDVSLERIVFLQMLGDGVFDDDDVWFNLKLGTPFVQIEEVVAQSFPWKSLAEKKTAAYEVMESIYTAGMMEHLKRQGQACKKCDIPLAVFAIHAARQKDELTKCPNPDCNAKVKIEDRTLEVAYDPFDMKGVGKRFHVFAG